jgi:hypothetical protein
LVEADVYSTAHLNSSLVFTLDFQSPEFAASYPTFWARMLDSLTVSPFESNGCTKAACTCWL